MMKIQIESYEMENNCEGSESWQRTRTSDLSSVGWSNYLWSYGHSNTLEIIKLNKSIEMISYSFTDSESNPTYRPMSLFCQKHAMPS